MILLLITTIYFWVIFRDFVNRQTLGSGTLNVPWIGNSDDIVSRVVFYLTLFFPLYTAGYLAWIEIQSEEVLYRRVLYGLGPLAIAVLVIGIALRHMRITASRNIAKH